jgi:hypothetical protein
MSLFVLSYAQTLLTRTSEMSLISNFLTEISFIEGNPQTLPQIRIDDVEAASCLNVTAIICPNNMRFSIIYRLGHLFGLRIKQSRSKLHGSIVLTITVDQMELIFKSSFYCLAYYYCINYTFFLHFQ